MAMQIIVNEQLAQGTNVNDINVPEHMRKRVSLGIDWVDKLFGGVGAIPSMVVLFTGTPGAGKTTLSLQLAAAISARPDSIALFNTREESPFQVKMTTERLRLGNFLIGNDLLVPSKEDLSDLHPSIQANWNKKNSDGTPKHTSLIDNLKYTMDSNPGKQVFLIGDSLQSFNDGKYGPDTINARSQVRVVEQLASFAKNGYNGSFPIIVMIGQVTKAGEFEGPNTVKHAIDAHVHLCIDEDKRSETYGRRLIDMSKNRFGCCGTKIILDMGQTGLTYAGEYSWADTTSAKE
jgi:DNA repair protein RadA/Sms